MKNLFLSFVLIIVSVCASFADSTLTVSGTGRAFAPPDTANIRLGVEVIGKTASSAQNNNAEVMQKVISSIQNLGISKDKIQTSSFNIWPEITYENKKGSKITGYRCSNQVSITISDDLSKISKIIDSGINSGVNQVLGLNFSRKNDLEFKNQALSDAMKEAASKAKAIASASGLILNGIDKIIEGDIPVSMQDNMISLKSAGGASTPISTGDIEIVKTVTVIYRLGK